MYISKEISIIFSILLISLVILTVPLWTLDVNAQTTSFPPGTFVVPMDDKQNNVTRAFGFIHAVLRYDGAVYRVIEPPDITLTTIENDTDTYAGGVFLIPQTYADKVSTASSAYPEVTIHHLATEVTIDTSQLFYITEEPTILIVYGEYGRTDILLTEMGIPFTMVYTWDVEADPSMLFDYDIIVIDCPGWAEPSTGAGNWVSAIPEDVSNAIKQATYNGAIVVYTDIAMLDANVTFPNYVELMNNIEGTSSASIHNPPLTGFDPEFLSQYWGPSTVNIYTMRNGYVIEEVINTSYVRIFVDSDNYGNTGQYAALDAYFPYGSGWVELVAFHPYEQTESITGDPNSYRAAAIIYGNKFIQRAPPPTTTPTTPTTPTTTTTTTTITTLTTTITTLTTSTITDPNNLIGGEISLNTALKGSSNNSIPITIAISAAIIGAIVALVSYKKK